MGLSVGNFRNFWDYFWTVLAEFSRLFSNSSDGIFGTIFGQSRIVLRFGFDPENDLFGFCCVFWYDCNLVMNGKKKQFIVVKGPRGALFYMGPRFGPFCVDCLKNK